MKFRVIAAIEAQDAVLPMIQIAPRTGLGRLCGECRAIHGFAVVNVNDTWSVFYTTFAKFSGRIFYTKNNGYLAVIVHLSGVFHLGTQLIDALIESHVKQLQS